MKTSSWLSKSIKITAVLALATAAIGFANSAKALEIDYASAPGGLIVFPGDSTFHFTAGDNLQIVTGTASGFLGSITGTFNIVQPITILIPGLVERADVTGSGTFVIHDPANGDLTADLTWNTIGQLGANGALNFQADVNMTNITYSGANPDLVALATAGSAVNVLSFQFTSLIPLTVLATHTGGDITNSFSGAIVTVPDGGATVMLLGAALGVLGIARRALKR
jgi:VPDSG-CTERM motif